MDPRSCDRGERVPAACTVTAALRQHVDAYRRHFTPTPHQDRVLDWLCSCQTSALGGREIVCAQCGRSSFVYNACRNRHCPQCRGGVRAAWLEARREQLLPVPHFQVVFTLPSRLRELAHDNPAVVYDLLFRAAVATLQTLAQQRLGGHLGVVAVLHTWTNDLRFHPHVHLLVTAGALRSDLGAWVRTRDDYLFPGRVMADLFRGRFTEALRASYRAGALAVRGPPAHAAVAFDAAVRAACRHRWVVHVEPPQGRPADQAAKYLARYVHGVALSNARMVAVTEDDVTFRTRTGQVTLEGHVFVRLFLLHVLPKRFRRVRYYGVYAPGNVHSLWMWARELLHAPVPPDRTERAARTCPACGHHVLVEHAIPGLPMAPPRSPPRARGPP